jgi:hypothetical protein
MPNGGHLAVVRMHDEVVNYRGELEASAEKDRLDHHFNFGGHLFGGDAVGSLVPASGGAEDGPGGGGGKQFRIGAWCDGVVGGAFEKHVLYDRNDGTLERHPGQLTRTARGLGEIIADPQRNGSERPIAICERKAAACDQVAEAGGGHGLQEGVLVRVMEVEGGPVQGSFIGDLLDGDVVELLASQ